MLHSRLCSVTFDAAAASLAPAAMLPLHGAVRGMLLVGHPLVHHGPWPLRPGLQRVGLWLEGE